MAELSINTAYGTLKTADDYTDAELEAVDPKIRPALLGVITAATNEAQAVSDLRDAKSAVFDTTKARDDAQLMLQALTPQQTYLEALKAVQQRGQSKPAPKPSKASLEAAKTLDAAEVALLMANEAVQACQTAVALARRQVEIALAVWKKHVTVKTTAELMREVSLAHANSPAAKVAPRIQQNQLDRDMERTSRGTSPDLGTGKRRAALPVRSR